MALNTIARPYAKAIFDLATQENRVSDWAQLLTDLTLLVKDSHFVQFLDNPSLTKLHSKQFLKAVLNEINPKTQSLSSLEAFIDLMVESKRVRALGEIAKEFFRLRDVHEQRLAIKVQSYHPLSDIQKDKLSAALVKRFSQGVTLEEEIDKSLLGGIIVRAGDLVIDGSVRGKLNQLANVLVG